MALINYQDYFDFDSYKKAIKDAGNANKDFGTTVQSVNDRIKKSYDSVTKDLKDYVTVLQNFNVNQNNAASAISSISGNVNTLVKKQQQQKQTMLELAQVSDLSTRSLTELKAAAKGVLAEFESVTTATKEDIEYKRQLSLEYQRLTTAAKEQAATLKAANAAINAPVNVPFSHNLEALEKQKEIILETGTVINEFDKAQAEAANSATAFTATQKVVNEEVNETRGSFIEIAGELDKYTGTLRENIVAQIENNNAIAANKAAQKEIQTAIAQSGTATDAQLQKLAELKQEYLLLTESNKQLSATIKSQAKDFLSTEGSIEALQSKVALLQAAYIKLSEVERASPFGLEIKSQIDLLEPKVKELEGTIGKFQRNVGNYAGSLQSAFSLLETELAKIREKLATMPQVGSPTVVAGFAKLQQQEAALNNITAKLSQNFTTARATVLGYRQAATQLGETFGVDSAIAANFSKEIEASGIKLEKTSLIGNKSSTIFRGLFTNLRNIAYIIPGLGLAGLIGLLLTPLEAAGKALLDYVGKLTAGSQAMQDMKHKQELLNEAISQSENEYTAAVKNVDQLKIAIDLAKQGFIDKQEVVNEYNKTIGQTTGQVKTLDEAEQALEKNAQAYIQFTLLKAAANIALQESAKKVFEAEQEANKKPKDFEKLSDQFKDASAQQFQTAEDIKRSNEAIRNLQAQRQLEAVQGAQKEASDLKSIGQKLFEDAAKIAKEFHFDLFPDTKTTTKEADRALRLYKEELAKKQALAKAEFDQEVANQQSLLDQKKITEADFQQTKYNAAVKYAAKAIELETQANNVGYKADAAKIKEFNVFKLNALNDYYKAAQKLNEDASKEDKVLLQNQIQTEAELLTNSLSKQRDLQLQNKALTDLEKVQLETQYNDKIDKINIDALNARAALEIDVTKKAELQKQAVQLQTAIDTRDKLLQQKENDFVMEQIYDYRRRQIDVQYAKDTSGLFSSQYKAAQKRFADELELYKNDADKKKEIIKQQADYEEQIQIEAYQRIAQTKQQIEQDVETLITQSIGEIINQRYEDQLSRLEKQKENELQIVGSNQAAQDAINKRYAQEEAKIKRKQAIAQKEEALFQIAINTAAAIMKNNAELGFIAAQPLNILTLIEGALQAAIVIAKPIPKFFKGRDGGPATPAIVDERGGELIVNKFGRIKEVGNDSGPRLTYLQEGDKVIPHQKTLEIQRIAKEISLTEKLSGNIKEGKRAEQIYIMSKALEGTGINYGMMGEEFGKQLDKRPVHQTIIDERGQMRRIKKANETKTFLNKYKFGS